MKRNVSDTLAAISLLLTLTGITFEQSLPQPLMPSNERAKDERYLEHLLWSQIIPRLRQLSADNRLLNIADQSEIMNGASAKNSYPVSAKGNNGAHRASGGNIIDESVFYPAAAAEVGSEFEAAGSTGHRVQRRNVKRYKLSFYDCIALYCQDQQGDDRNSCILNSCNRSRQWPRK